MRDPAELALFLNHRGERLTRQGLWLIIKHYVEAIGIEAEVTPIRCATPSPPTCSMAAPSSAMCRSCWATPTSRRPGLHPGHT